MNFYLKLAKKTVEKYVKEKKITSPPKGIPEHILQKKAPVFISIKKCGNFRACIGTIEAIKENIIEEIIYNSISAARNDYRLGPIKEEELSQLTYEVYILGKPEIVRDIKDLNPKKYGIIVRDKKFKTGVLLPDLDGIVTAEKQLAIVLEKAGIVYLGDKKDFFNDIFVYRFRAIRYKN